MLKTPANKHILEDIRIKDISCKRMLLYLHIYIEVSRHILYVYSEVLFWYSNNAMNNTKYTVISWLMPYINLRGVSLIGCEHNVSTSGVSDCQGISIGLNLGRNIFSPVG